MGHNQEEFTCAVCCDIFVEDDVFVCHRCHEVVCCTCVSEIGWIVGVCDKCLPVVMEKGKGYIGELAHKMRVSELHDAMKPVPCRMREVA